MSQTLFAILALALTALLGLSYARSRTGEIVAADRAELEMMAASAGVDVLDQLAALPFDAATRTATVTDRSLLTTPFTTGRTIADARNVAASAQDVDDVHGMRTLTYQSERGIAFTLDATVRYVDEANPSVAAAAPTFAKEVTVTVRGARLLAPVVLSQVFTYQP